MSADLTVRLPGGGINQINAAMMTKASTPIGSHRCHPPPAAPRHGAIHRIRARRGSVWRYRFMRLSGLFDFHRTQSLPVGNALV